MFNVELLADTLVPGSVIKQSIRRSDLSTDQLDVYDKIIAWRNDPNARQYIKIGGYAGTGKTTLVAALAAELQSHGDDIAYTAFTGKAINVLSRKLYQAGINGWFGTLHALMYKPKSDSNGKIIGWGLVPNLPFTLIVVDEASMISADLWEDLLSFKIPIIAVGDHGQLPPVGDAVINLMRAPDLRLEKIHRQAAGNPILALAQHVREGKSHLTFESYDSRVQFIPSVAAIANRITDPINFGAICYTNKTRSDLNRYIRKIRNINSVYPEVGDIVICLKNKKPIFNGMRGILVETSRDFDSYDNFLADVLFADDALQLHSLLHLPQFNQPTTLADLAPLKIKYSNQKISWNNIGMLFDYGYAMTCHKAQGSQFKDVVIVFENLFRDADTRARWMYTAVTRASEQLYIVKT